MHSDTIVRWNTAKELPNRKTTNTTTPNSPHGKRDMQFNLPEIRFSHDDGSTDWLSNESNHHDDGSTDWLSNENDSHDISVDDSRPPLDYTFLPRADSISTHVLDNSLARADHVLRLRKQARRERRALKESGDYLGVQGVNPETGRMDVETPTDSEESHPSLGASPAEHSQPKRMIVTFDPRVTEKEHKKMLLKAREDELRRIETSKLEAEEVADQLMWRRHTKEWSIVKDPGASRLQQQLGSPPENSPASQVPETSHKVQENLIDLDDLQREVSSAESLDSNSANERASCGTVMRTPHQRSLADISRAGLELFENGISFDHSFRSKKASHATSFNRESSGGISPTTKVRPDPDHIANSKWQPFLENGDHNSKDPTNQMSKLGHRTDTRKTFRAVTNSLRATTSLSNIFMANTQTRTQTMAKKHMLRRETTDSLTESHLAGARVKNVDQKAGRFMTMAPSLSTIQYPEPFEMTEDVRCGSTPDKTVQDTRMLSGGFPDLNCINHSKEDQEGHSLGVRGRTEDEASNTPRAVQAKDGSVYTHTTITTGSMLLTAPQLEGRNAPVANEPGMPTASCPEKTWNVLSKAVDTQIATPNDTTSLAGASSLQDAIPFALKTTRAAHRLQLREKKTNGITQSVGPKATPASHSLTEPQNGPKTMLKVAYAEDRKRKVVQREMERIHCDGCSECFRIPGSFPAHLIEDDGIVPHSASTYPYRYAAQATQATQTVQLGAVFDYTLGPFVAAIEIYCKVVWPVFDPYSPLWERNANKETTILDLVVLVLAIPGAIVILALAVWGLRVSTAVGSCLYSAGRGVASNASGLFGWY